ncbi:SET domain-containing [Paramuricea clavata]|uniref:SET domain-containing n=1 Tax=Paramuricea clavata TaxID=317549 RepID=A0A6S7INI8_PARCT|nr:SET domain-containing [Paramuricea clavata]
MATGHINIHFKSLTNPQENYVADYEFNDDDQDITIIPILFNDALALWCHNHLEAFVKISIDDLWSRFADMCTTQTRRKRKPRSQSIRKSQQCVSNTQKDVRCRKRTAHTEKCWIHLAKQNNLRIKPSNVAGAGKGLFAWKKPITRGKLISKYTGRKLSKKELDKKYGDGVAKYAVCNKRGRCVDATYTTDAAARFVNDSRGTSFQNNAKIKGNQMFKLKATKKIPANQEIFTSYGNEYWE